MTENPLSGVVKGSARMVAPLAYATHDGHYLGHLTDTTWDYHDLEIGLGIEGGSLCEFVYP